MDKVKKLFSSKALVVAIGAAIILVWSTYLVFPIIKEESGKDVQVDNIINLDKVSLREEVYHLVLEDFGIASSLEEDIQQTNTDKNKDPRTTTDTGTPDKEATDTENKSGDNGNQQAPSTSRGAVQPQQPQQPQAQPQPEEQSQAALSHSLNSYVLEAIKAYDYRNVRYPYLLNNDYQNYNGVTMNLYYQDRLLLKAHPSGSRASHCSGITFEVFLKAMEARNRAAGIESDDINEMTYDNVRDFIAHWYVALGSKKTANITTAVQKYGIGRGITTLEDARPGDFIDISRENNTGHTAVFINWITQGDQIIGVRYWSSQQSTMGISYNEEYFNVLDQNSKKYGNVMIDQVYIARISPINQYRSFR